MLDDFITTSLAQISEQDKDLFLYTSYCRGKDQPKANDWAGCENILLMGREESPCRTIRNSPSVDHAKLPRLSRSTDLTPKAMPQIVNKSQILTPRNKIRLVEVVLPMPKNFEDREDREYEYRIAYSIEKEVSNRLLRRRYKRKQQIEIMRGRPLMPKRNIGELYTSVKPLNSRYPDLSSKISEFRRAIRLRHEDTLIDLSTSHRFM